ncbi:MAG: PIN domain nuclease [Steroidobacteraceae bacterium]
MILVDTSVWIDYFRGADTPETDTLDNLLGVELAVTGDLILTEVLQGFISEREFDKGRKLFASIPLIPLVGEDIAVQAARNFRKLRTLGITIRKTIDTLIATSCIEKELTLLYSDRDFDPFVKHLGLRSALSGSSSSEGQRRKRPYVSLRQHENIRS